MADSNLLVWIMRLQQTEALIERRKEDLQGHEQRAANLQTELKHEHNLLVSEAYCCLLSRPLPRASSIIRAASMQEASPC